MAQIIRTFLAGLMVLLPLALTLLVVGWVANLLMQYLGPHSVFGGVLTSLGLGLTTSAIGAYVIGALIVCGCIYLLGLGVRFRLEHGIRAATESLIRRIPLVGSVYDITKRFVDLVDHKEGDALKGMQPVWCALGGNGGAAVLALRPTAEPIVVNETTYNVILVPTAPVPFGGGLIYVPADWIRPANVGLEGLMNIYVSMGVSSPKLLQSIGLQDLNTSTLAERT